MQNKQKSVEEEFTLVAPAALVCDEFVNSLLHLEKMPRVSSTMSSKALWLSQLQFYHEWNDLFLYHVANVFFFFSFMLNTGVNTVSASSGHNRKCSQGALILLVVHPPTLRCAAYTRHNFIFKMFWTVYNSQICSLGTPRDLLTESGAAPSQGKHCSVWTRAHTSQTQRDTTHGQTFHCGPACSAETCCDKCDSSFIKS